MLRSQWGNYKRGKLKQINIVSGCVFLFVPPSPLCPKKTLPQKNTQKHLYNHIVFFLVLICKKSQTGPTFHGPRKKPEYLIARSLATYVLRGPLGFGPWVNFFCWSMCFQRLRIFVFEDPTIHIFHHRFFAFMLVMVMVLLNMLVAILMEAYAVVKEDAKNADSL